MEQNFIRIRNFGNTGLDTIVCDTTLDGFDIELVLNQRHEHFDGIDEIPALEKVPENASCIWYTPLGEYEIRRELMSGNPDALALFPEINPKRRK